MRSTCRAFLQPNPPAWLRDAGVALSPEVVAVADAFDYLQERRHDADYNHLASFTRARVKDAIRRAEEAFAAWDAIRGNPDADLFLIALLVRPR